jgi:hypothetical protein
MVAPSTSFLIGDLAVLAWLVPLAFYDLRTRRVPLSVFVTIPLLVALLEAVLRGRIDLVGGALLILILSERDRIRYRWLRVTVLIIGICVLSYLGVMVISPDVWMGYALMCVFWIMEELNVAAAADSLIGIALALHWSDVRLPIAFVVSTALVFLARHKSHVLHILTLRALTNDSSMATWDAGLPGLAIAASLCTIWNWVLPNV